MGNIQFRLEKFKDIVEKEAREEKEDTTEQDEEKKENNFTLTATENKKSLKGTYKSFAIPGIQNV